MCFGGGKIKQPEIPPAVTAAAQAPAPTATASVPEETASRLAEKKRKLALAQKYGQASTVKTSGMGDISAVNLLLPAVMGTSGKTKLGQ
jgi:hypothetical protein